MYIYIYIHICGPLRGEEDVHGGRVEPLHLIIIIIIIIITISTIIVNIDISITTTIIIIITNSISTIIITRSTCRITLSTAAGVYAAPPAQRIFAPAPKISCSAS